MFLFHSSPFWDLLLIEGFSCILFLSLLCLRTGRRSMGVRSVFLTLLGLLGGLLCLAFIDATMIEPFRIVTVEEEVSLPIEEPLTIAVLSDFHVGPYVSSQMVERLVEHANTLEPDLILLAGDFMDISSEDATALGPLRNLQSRLGTFAVLGNHDQRRLPPWYGMRSTVDTDRGTLLTTALMNLGITVLRNENRSIHVNSDDFFVAGSDDVWSRTFDLTETFAGIPQDAPTILLAHNPDVLGEPLSRRANLIVSGHTHGGQVRLPLLGPLGPLPTKLGRAVDRGVFRVSDTSTLVLSSGVGQTLMRLRFFDPPEVVKIVTENRALLPPLPQGED